MGISSVPSKFITYLAVGKPVLCSIAEDTEIADLVRSNDLGIVVPPGDVDRIVEGILELSSLGRHRLLQKGQRAREFALRMYSIARAKKDFQKVLDSVRVGD
jgi:colanic acid biosynthesis glycosyl transferase WcaI